MPIKLFNLKNVPDDEAEEIRVLLNNHGIEFYETPAGNWAASAPAIWLNDGRQEAQARMLIDEYQRERATQAREEYVQLLKEGKSRTIIDLILENPVRFVFYLAVIAAIVYFSTKLLMDIGK